MNARSSSLNASSARAVVQVQHAEHAAVVQERHRYRGLHVEPLAHDPEALAIGLAAQAQRLALGRDAPGDPFAERHADLRPQLALDAHRDAHRELAARLVHEHERAALGARHADRDLEHAHEELVGVDRQVVGVDHLVQRLEQVGLALVRGHAEPPEQPRGERRHHLEAALERRREALGERAVLARVDHRVQRRVADQRLRVVRERLLEQRRDAGRQVRQAVEQAQRVGVDDGRDLDGGIRAEQRDQREGLVGGPVDADPLAHQSPLSGASGSIRTVSTTEVVPPSSSPSTSGMRTLRSSRARFAHRHDRERRADPHAARRRERVGLVALPGRVGERRRGRLRLGVDRELLRVIRLGEDRLLHHLLRRRDFPRGGYELLLAHLSHGGLRLAHRWSALAAARARRLAAAARCAMLAAPRLSPRSARITFFEIVDSAWSRPRALGGDRLEHGGAREAEPAMQLLRAVGVGEIALVVLHDERDLVDRARVVLERLAELFEAREVLLGALAPAVHHEHDPVHLVEQLLARRRVLGRARHRDQLDPRAQAADVAELDRKHGVADRRIEARRHLAHLAAVIGAQLAVDALETRALAGAFDAPVHDPRVHLGAPAGDLRHQSFPFLVRIRRAWVAITVGTSLLFISFCRSLSCR